MKFQGYALTIARNKEEKPARGTWGSNMQVRKRKGLHYFLDFYQAPTGGMTDDYRRPDRILSDSQIWEIYRRCSDVRASVDSIVRRVATFDWIVEPAISPQDEGYSELAEISQQVKTFLERPNKNGHTWQEIMTAFLTDVLCFDAGAIELVYTKDGKLAELVPLRGSSVTPITDSYGRILTYQQTMYEGGEAFQLPTEGPQKTSAVQFKPSQMLFFSLFANTANPVGTPLTESLVNEVIALLRASEHAMLALDADEIPQGILILSGIAGKAAEQAKADLQRLRGQDHKIRVMTTPDPAGTGAQWLQLNRNPKEITMRELVESIRRSVYRTFGVMPVEMGMTDGMPRATASVQMDVASSHLVTPILELLQAKINAQIIPSLIGEENAARIMFRFDRDSRADPEDQKRLAEMHQIYIKNGVMTRNEVREMLGFLPVDGGDVPTFEVAGMPSPLSALGDAPKNEAEAAEPAGDPVEPFKPSDINDEEELEAEEVEAFSFFLNVRDDDDDLASYKNRKKAFKALSKKVQKALEKKVEDHQEKVGKDRRKKTDKYILAVCFHRGVGAYHNNPSSVRPTVKSPEQWAFARVNSFLYALENLKFKGKPFDTDLLPASHPLATREGRRAVGDVDPTNFPKSGDNKKVSLRNSEHKLFDLDFAEKIRVSYPEIWKKGGNILGNKQFSRLKRVIQNGVKTETDEEAVRLREAWGSRHYEDFRIAGVVAQIKWLVVGSRGEKYMKDLIRDEIKKLEGRTIKETVDDVHDVDVMSDEEREVAMMRALELPSDWQPEGRFKGEIVLPLDKLGKMVSDYAKEVLPVYRKHRDEALKVIRKVFNQKMTSAQASEQLAKILLSLSDKWGEATEPLYYDAGELGASWAQELTKVEGMDFNAQRKAYFDKQMGYLTNGLINDLRVGMIALLQEARSIQMREIADFDVEGEEDELEDFYKLDAAAAAAIIYLLWAKNEYRIALFSGRLVEVANADSSSVMIASPVNYMVEWIAVGDKNTCSVCLAQDARGRFPVSELSIVPAGGTPCGGRCRCVLVYFMQL